MADPTTTALQRLSEVKNDLKLIVFDFDGTVYRKPEYTETEVHSIIKRILHSGKDAALVTAREASMHAKIIVPFKEELEEGQTLFLGTSNGRVIRRITRGKVEVIQKHGISWEEIEKVTRAYESLGLDLEPEVAEHFTKDWEKDWSGIIPTEYFNYSKEHLGIWAEETKMVIGLKGEDSEVKELRSKLQQLVGGTLHVGWAGWKLVDVNKDLGMDGKLYAVREISKILGIGDESVAAFGDRPDGNDSGMLTLPYSFTNNEEYYKKYSNMDPEGNENFQGSSNGDKKIDPPYLLPHTEHPVESIYVAIDSLL